ANFPQAENESAIVVASMWLVEIRPNKTCAFRTVDGFDGLPADGQSHVVATVSATFQASDFAAGHLKKLSDSIHAALMADGLFADEADALLNTWKLSYFETPGMRLFYLLPRTWTDYVLPLTVSREADIVRSMTGRIELVTPRDRELLREISDGPGSEASSV